MILGQSTTNDNEPMPIGYYLKQLRAKIIKERKIDESKLMTKEQLDEKAAIEATASWQRQKQRFFASQSLWPANIKLDFCFEQWQPELQEDAKMAREIGKQAYLAAKELTTGNKHNLVFVGAPGTGKTSLALAVAAELKKLNQGFMFVSTAELAGLYQQKQEYIDISKKISKVEESMKQVDVLLLDDLGTEGFAAFHDRGVRTDMQNLMYRVANARFDFKNNRVGKITLVTTNNTQEQLKKMYDPKIISRLVPDPNRDKKHRITFNGLTDVRGV